MTGEIIQFANRPTLFKCSDSNSSFLQVHSSEMRVRIYFLEERKKQMNYCIMNESDVEEIAKLYMDYYNNNEDGCWKYEKAYKRVHQMVTIEDSLCLIQKDDESNTTGFVIGYFKEYDDISVYYLEEIV
ncbi:MAG: hypothetical protein ACI4F0_08150, partial [Agathobacter sp.]